MSSELSRINITDRFLPWTQRYSSPHWTQLR